MPYSCVCVCGVVVVGAVGAVGVVVVVVVVVVVGGVAVAVVGGVIVVGVVVVRAVPDQYTSGLGSATTMKQTKAEVSASDKNAVPPPSLTPLPVPRAGSVNPSGCITWQPEETGSPPVNRYPEPRTGDSPRSEPTLRMAPMGCAVKRNASSTQCRNNWPSPRLGIPSQTEHMGRE